MECKALVYIYLSIYQPTYVCDLSTCVTCVVEHQNQRKTFASREKSSGTVQRRDNGTLL